MSRKLTKEEIVERAKNVHKDKYDYTDLVYKDMSTNINVKCKIHGEFFQRPFDHLKGLGCSKCGIIKSGLTRTLTNNEFIEKANSIHGDKYKYTNVNYVNAFIPVTITCLLHGDYKQKPYLHLNGRGCHKCKADFTGNRLRSNKEEFINKANQIHKNKYDYSVSKYKDARTKIKINCSKHGIFTQRPRDHLTGNGCPRCKDSKGELLIFNILSKNGINFKQQFIIPDQIYKFRYDFYLPDHNLLIEFHGIQHYKFIPYFHKEEDNFLLQKERDMAKKWLAKELNYKLLEFNYKQLNDDFENIFLNSLNK